jgi:hypothetical protein
LSAQANHIETKKKRNSIHSASIEATRLTPTELGRTQTAQTLLNQPAIAGDVHLNNSRNQKPTTYHLQNR